MEGSLDQERLEMNFDFSGKRALVTGAAQGIGLAIAKKLAFFGAEVVAVDINEEELKNVSRIVPNITTVAVDVGDWKSTSEALSRIGHVQLLVNNAANHLPSSISDITKDIVDRTFDVNIKGIMQICQHVTRDMIASEESGAIVNVASVGGVRCLPGLAVYGASKASLLNFTKGLALEYAPHGIRVNSVSPGLTRTKMAEADISDPVVFAELSKLIPMKTKICEPEDVANAVLFLLSEEYASKITGVDIPVDCGILLS